MKLKYSNLTALLLMLATVFFLVFSGVLSGAQAFALVVMFQAAMFLLEPQRAVCFASGLTDAQVREFSQILEGFKDYEGLFKKLSDGATNYGGIDKFFERFEQLEKASDDTAGHVKRLRKAGLNSGGGNIRFIGDKPFVTDECAAALTSALVVRCAQIDGGLEQLVSNAKHHDAVLSHAKALLGGVERTAMSGTEIPLPTQYIPQIVELVYLYGQARQYATVFPLGAGKVNLPRLKVGEDDFGYIGVGISGGMSQNVPEKRVPVELVEFDANKAGGIIRLPTELEEDTFIPIGQFLARYIARQFAKLEDKTLFLADGTNAYAQQTGVGPYCAANPNYLLKLAGGKTKPSDITLNDFRNLRGKVSPALLGGGYTPAYYVNPTFEGLLTTFNTIGSPMIYQRLPDGKAILDGFPIRWVGAAQTYSAVAAPNTFPVFFGDLSYWYLGEKGAPRVEVSREVYFATDELGMRALERIDVEAMAEDAMAAIQLPAE